MNRRLGGVWLAGVGCLLGAMACAPTSSEVGQEPDGGSMQPGGHAGESAEGDVTPCTVGTKRLAPDGCNTCTCQNGDWACTDEACACTDGEARDAGDGCNTCTCQNGDWACTQKACGSAVCQKGDTRSDGCTSCVCQDFGQGAMWACTTNACPEKCTPGEMKSAGCNTCFCQPDGSWACTLEQCASDCASGFADCDGDSGNGCETSIATSVMNCGGCGIYCVQAGATSTCVNGKCEIDQCTTGYADCNGDAADGCEAVVGAGGCQDRCELPEGAAAAAPATGDCDCPSGTTCVRHGHDHPNGDYCLPLPKTCPSYGTCGCMGPCACDDGWQASCTEQMQIGQRMIVDCTGTLP